MAEPNFIVDPEFKRLLPELSSTELAHLEATLLAEGCVEPIVIWNNTILDGIYRYEICKKHRLAYRVETLQFSCREEAIRWICIHQMGRPNVSPERVRYQIGKRYNTEKMLTAHNPRGRNQYSTVSAADRMRPPTERRMGTAAAIANTYSVSHFAVHTYKDIAIAIDKIAEKDSRLSDLYLSGQMRIKKDDLMSIAEMGKYQVRALTNNLLRHKKSVCRTQDVLDALSTRDLQLENQSARERRAAQVMATMPSVKDMPKHDPDGEIASLSLTIPSWNSSIARVFNKADMHEISDKAKKQLRVELLSLRDSIDLILLAIEEVSQNG